MEPTVERYLRLRSERVEVIEISVTRREYLTIIYNYNINCDLILVLVSALAWGSFKWLANSAVLAVLAVYWSFFGLQRLRPELNGQTERSAFFSVW